MALKTRYFLGGILCTAIVGLTLWSNYSGSGSSTSANHTPDETGASRDSIQVEPQALPERGSERVEASPDWAFDFEEELDRLDERVQAREYREMLTRPLPFARMQWHHGIGYEEVRKHFGVEDLPELYSLLSDRNASDAHPNIAQMIGFISDRGNSQSVQALADYFRREEDWSEASKDRAVAFSLGMGKILSLEWIGIIGGAEAEGILLTALDRAGAETLSSAWLAETAVAYPGGKESALASIRGRAAMGLVYTKNPNALLTINELYESEVRRAHEEGLFDQHGDNAPLLNAMGSALAYNDLIESVGLEDRLKLYGSGEEIDAVYPYVMNYLKKVIPGLMDNE